jgi:hypothetical protein
MPDEEAAASADGDKNIAIPAPKPDELPVISPPQTKTPISFNQQVNNFQQIPPSAWDGLTPVQRMELSKSILAQMDSMDQRHYDFAVKHVETETTRGVIRAVCGTVITVAGFSFAAYLAMHGQTILGLSISLPLATILAIVVGNRFVSRP